MVSRLVVSVLVVLSGFIFDELSIFVVLSVLLVAALSELQPDAIVPIMAIARAIVKICFFIGVILVTNNNVYL